ncbi:MAG TPA: hypothetical protein VMV82_04600 [Candidatus Dormibacteraeota bacterium]|nr:hypothetical protein [Candidatus Dormibacteraeota bacterium]
MFDVAHSLRSGFAEADRQLRDAQRAVARADAGDDRRGADAAMAAVARSVIFTEALLGATRARLQEIQTAAKG